MTGNESTLLIEARDLASRLEEDDLLLIGVCSAAVFAQRHLPGALHVEPAELVSGEKPAVGKLPSLERLSALFSRLGLRPGQRVVAYDDEGGGWAGRLIWTLELLGHENCAYLNGGLIAWLAEGLPVESGPATAQAAATGSPQFVAELTGAGRASQEDVLASIDAADTVVWDARSAEEYQGSRLSAMRNGHIPGAVNLDWLELMDREADLRLRPLPELASLLTERGMPPGKRLITHCQTHHRSGLSYLVARLLGYEVSAYDGSWAEWGNDPETPIVQGPEPRPAGEQR